MYHARRKRGTSRWQATSASARLDAFHVLEALQCMVERRKGGETGVRSVQCFERQDCWNFIERNGWVERLFEEALTHSKTRKSGTPKELVEEPTMFVLEYNDGLRAAAFLMTGLVEDFTVRGVVLFQVGIEQVYRHATDDHAPRPDVHASPRGHHRRGLLVGRGGAAAGAAGRVEPLAGVVGGVHDENLPPHARPQRHHARRHAALQ